MMVLVILFQALPPTTPLWLDLLKEMIGPAIAAVFVVIGLLWKDRIDRKNEAQAWFEEAYITEGVDVLIAQLAVLCHALNEARRLSLGVKPVALPSSVARRLFAVVPMDFLAAVDTAEALVIGAGRDEHPIALTADEYMEVLQFCVGLSVCAEELRQFLLTTKIKKKSDVYRIAKDPLYITKANQLLTNFLDDLDLNSMHFGLQDKFRKRITETAMALKKAKTATPDEITS